MDNEAVLLLIDVISILPGEIDLQIQAPSLDDEVILKMWDDTEYPYFKGIRLDNTTKELFFNRIKNYPIVSDFQSIEIRHNTKLLFEGFDGVMYGSLSNTILIPNWFKEKYIENEDYFIADNW